jgi:hypothetical protein
LLFPDVEDTIGMIYNIGVGINFLAYGFVFNHSVGFLLRELTIHIQNASNNPLYDIKIVYKRLRIAYLVGWVVFLSGGSLGIIFGSFSYLLKRSIYLVILFQIVMSPTLTVLIMTVSKISRVDSTKVVAVNLSDEKKSKGSFQGRASLTCSEQVKAAGSFTLGTSMIISQPLRGSISSVLNEEVFV